MRRVVAVLVVAVLAAGACAQEGADRDAAVPGRARSATSPPNAGAPPDGLDGDGAAASAFGDLTAPLVGGGTFESASVAGADLALWFWSPW